MINPRNIIQLHFRRFEFKHFIGSKQAEEIKKYVQHYLLPDPYSLPEKKYQVTSLYYDSPKLRFYKDTEAGLKTRVKVRQRFYNNDRENLFWEIKRKNNAVTTKNRCLVTDINPEFKSQLKTLKILHCLKPVTWVSYTREALVSSNRLVRITFDSNLHVAKALLCSEEIPLLHPINSIATIMEIKFNGRLPLWLYKLLQHYSTHRQSICKYRLAVEKSILN